MEVKKLKIKVAQRKTADGRTFNTFKTFSKNGVGTEVKFRKAVKELPEKDCYIVVDVDKAHLNTSGEYPVLWVEAIESIEDLATANAENNRKKLDEYFG